MTWHS